MYLQYVCMCVSVSIRDTPGRTACAWRPQVWRDDAEDGGRERNKEVTRVATGHQANCIQVEDHQKPRPPDAQDEVTRKTGGALMPSTCMYAACTDATLHTLTQHPPDTNKLEKPPQAKTSKQNASHMLTSIIMLDSVPRSYHQLLSVASASAWSLGKQTAEERGRRGAVGLSNFTCRSDVLLSPVICCFNPSLIPHSAF